MKSTNRCVANTIRNTSCSYGWLKTLNQILFGVITVLLFSLLMLVVLYEVITNNREPPSACDHCKPCVVRDCAVTCTNTNLQVSVNDPVARLMKEADSHCRGKGISVMLTNPIFQHGRIPVSWLFEHNYNISALDITGGNLRDIPPNAFISQSFNNLKMLTLSAIIVTRITSETFRGLSSLTRLQIRNAILIDIQDNSLRPLGKCLRTLQVKNCIGVNPRSFTGTPFLNNITIVDMTFNNLGSKLTRESFLGLKSCRRLYLSSSRITAIGEGAFDNLDNIMEINLNDNALKTLPGRIFDKLVASRADFINSLRIDLRNNPWHCDCQLENIRRLFQIKVIIGDPLCESPAEYKNHLFSSFHSFCFNRDVSKLSHIIETMKGTALMESTASITLNSTNVTTELITNSTVDMMNLISFSVTKLSMESSELESQIKRSYANNTLCEVAELFQKIDLLCENVDTSTFLHDWNLDLELAISQIKDTFNGTTTNKLESAIVLWKTIKDRFSAVNFINYDLVWFQTLCPTEIFCIRSNFLSLLSSLHNHLNVYCAVEKFSRTIKAENCITLLVDSVVSDNTTIISAWTIGSVYAASILCCMTVTALLVFIAVRKHPTLLRGSKRILLVQHRVADALVLPPKFPLKADIVRRDSIRSLASGTPSYISALQPTDEQLAEWRKNQLSSQFYEYGEHKKNISYDDAIQAERSMASYEYVDLEGSHI